MLERQLVANASRQEPCSKESHAGAGAVGLSPEQEDKFSVGALNALLAFWHYPPAHWAYASIAFTHSASHGDSWFELTDKKAGALMATPGTQAGAKSKSKAKRAERSRTANAAWTERTGLVVYETQGGVFDKRTNRSSAIRVRVPIGAQVAAIRVRIEAAYLEDPTADLEKTGEAAARAVLGKQQGAPRSPAARRESKQTTLQMLRTVRTYAYKVRAQAPDTDHVVRTMAFSVAGVDDNTVSTEERQRRLIHMTALLVAETERRGLLDELERATTAVVEGGCTPVSTPPEPVRRRPSSRTETAEVRSQSGPDGTVGGQEDPGSGDLPLPPTVPEPVASEPFEESAYVVGDPTYDEDAGPCRRSESARAVAAFESAGADMFGVVTGDRLSGNEEPDGYVFAADVTDRFCDYLADGQDRALILKPRTAGCNDVPIAVPGLVHIEDAGEAERRRCESFAFLTVESSPGSFHVWLKVDEEDPTAIRKGMVAAAKRLAPGSEINSGRRAMRWPGSINTKAKYRRDDGAYPIVRIVSANPGRVTTRGELAAAGLFVDPAPKRVQQLERYKGAPVAPERRGWPSYDVCLRRAPRRKDGGPDRSWADNEFALLALARGWSESAIAAKLAVLSEKAREEGSAYVSSKVADAALYVGGGARC